MNLEALALIHLAESRGGVREPAPRRPRRPRRWSLRSLVRRRPATTAMPGIAATTPPPAIRSTTADVVVVVRHPA